MTNLSDFLKCKKVKCVENYGRSLTVGKIYNILGIIVPLQEIRVENDTGANVEYDIYCFEPVIDSAENPLQKMELTPEFEAVEPITAPRFEAGQKAYCPWLNEGKLIQLEANRTSGLFAETVKGRQYFNEDGTSVEVTSPAQPDLFHATQENYELLSKLMPWVNFEAPPKPLSGDGLVRAMLTKGIKNVLCLWVNGDKIVIDGLDCKGALVSINNKIVSGLTPIDWCTGEPLTEAVLDE